ncbi:MAG: hypothetical protein WAK20_16920 [Candidatus Acidiferrum sp.]
MNRSTPRHLLHYVTRRLRLRQYLKDPGDGRQQPQIPAQALLWALLIGQILRQSSFHAVEALARSSARRTLSIATPFCDDTLGYFTERLDPGPTRQALLSLIRGAKRNKAFDDCRWIGLAIDGTGAGWRTQAGCKLCRPKHTAVKQILGYQHSFVILGLHVVARLKDNLPELFAAARHRFPSGPPTTVFQHGPDRVEVWDAEDFDPWKTLEWETVRVFFYRQHKPDGTVVEAYWLTNFPSSTVGSQSLFRMAKSRWEIENQGFNDAKSRHGLEHICHHHANSLLIGWLLAMLALTIERLYPLRYLHRGKHQVHSSAQLLLLLWLSLSRPRAANSS